MSFNGSGSNFGYPYPTTTMGRGMGSSSVFDPFSTRPTGMMVNGTSFGNHFFRPLRPIPIPIPNVENPAEGSEVRSNFYQVPDDSSSPVLANAPRIIMGRKKPAAKSSATLCTLRDQGNKHSTLNQPNTNQGDEGGLIKDPAGGTNNNGKSRADNTAQRQRKNVNRK